MKYKFQNEYYSKNDWGQETTYKSRKSEFPIKFQQEIYDQNDITGDEKEGNWPKSNFIIIANDSGYYNLWEYVICL